FTGPSNLPGTRRTLLAGSAPGGFPGICGVPKRRPAQLQAGGAGAPRARLPTTRRTAAPSGRAPAPPVRQRLMLESDPNLGAIWRGFRGRGGGVSYSFYIGAL